MRSREGTSAQWVLTIVAVIGLAVDAFVHFHLASDFQHVKTSTLSEADLFRVEAAAATIAAIALLVRRNRYTAGFAFLVSAAGTVAVVLYRYVNVGGFGPIPNMYDPFWAPAEKNLSVIAEVLAAVAALVLFLQFHAASRSSTTADGARERARLNG